MPNWSALVDALLVLGGFGIGWLTRARAPEGIEWMAWLKASRKLARFRRAVAP